MGKRVLFEDRELCKKLLSDISDKEIEGSQKMCCAEAEGATHLRMDELFASEEESNQQWINPRLQFRNYKIMWILWATPGSSVIVKRRAIMGHPTSPVAWESSESSRIDWPRFFASRQGYGTHLVCWKSFWRLICSERISRNLEIVKYSISCFTSRHGHRRETRPNPFGEHHKCLVHTFGLGRGSP